MSPGETTFSISAVLTSAQRTDENGVNKRLDLCDDLVDGSAQLVVGESHVVG